MRKQIIDLFEDWLDYWHEHKTSDGSWASAFEQWVADNHPELSDGERQEIAACHECRDGAVCWWETDPREHTIHIIVKNYKIKETNPNINF